MVISTKTVSDDFLIRETFPHTERWYKQHDYISKEGVAACSFWKQIGHKAPWIKVDWFDLPKHIQDLFWNEQRKAAIESGRMIAR